jgi:hypothetical protein
MITELVRETLTATRQELAELHKLLSGNELPPHEACAAVVKADGIRSAVGELRRKVVSAPNEGEEK